MKRRLLTSAPSSAAPARLVLTAREVAAAYDISTASVWRGVASGRIPKPFYPAERSPRWPREQIEAAMTEQSTA